MNKRESVMLDVFFERMLVSVFVLTGIVFVYVFYGSIYALVIDSRNVEVPVTYSISEHVYK